MENPYAPSEDSYLLSKYLKKTIRKIKKSELKKIKFLDMGVGSGIQAKTALSSGIKKQNIFCIDINKKAIENCKKLGFNCIESDLFEKLDEKDFDVIAFNAPYLPENKYDKKKDTTGGKKGDETILKFLKQCQDFVNKKTIILIVLSSFTPKNKIKKLLIKQKMNYKKVGGKKLFYEKIYVWEIKKS